MKILFAAACLALTIQASKAGIEVIYGEDNRKDIYETKNALHKKLATASASMIHLGFFKKAAKENFLDLGKIITLEAGDNVCASEKFSQQPLAPNCSGFLVGPNTIVTAGHCYTAMQTAEETCQSFAWVFDYALKSENDDPSKNISMNNVYLCKKVFMVKKDGLNDFAIIKLNRDVKGREPLKFRENGVIPNNTSLVTIGNPSGLPTKITNGGNVLYNGEANNPGLYFLTNLDTFHGNSGSAVFDAKTGLVEGILIMGKDDYIPSNPENANSCKVVNVCSNFANNCKDKPDAEQGAPAEVVYRITNLATYIKEALAEY